MKTVIRRVIYSFVILVLPISTEAATFADLDGSYSTNFTSLISVSGFGSSKGPAFTAPCTIAATAGTLECDLGGQKLLGTLSAGGGKKISWSIDQAGLSGLQSQIASGVSAWLSKVAKKFNTKVDPSSVSFVPTRVRFKPISLPKGALKSAFKADLVITGKGSAKVNGSDFNSNVNYTVTLKFNRS